MVSFLMSSISFIQPRMFNKPSSFHYNLTATRARVKINRDCYRECRNLIESWNRGIHRRMERMEDRHTHERVYVWKNMKPGIVQDIRPINYNISTVKLNRSFLVN